jgi:NAD+ kinase
MIAKIFLCYDAQMTQPAPFHSVILFGKRHHEKTMVETLLHLKKHLEKKKIDVFIEEETAKICRIKQTSNIICENQLSHYGELIVVVGGDGSLLNAARAAVFQNLPVLGINRGKLGFLTDISPGALADIDKVLKGHYQEEERFLLQADVLRNNKICCQKIALNDVVLQPGDISRMIEFSIEINQEFVCVQRADGLIVATPTGSTAYALSGGGPILHSQLDALVLVPMFPHKLTSRPIVVSGSSLIKITLDKHNETLPQLSCDGQAPWPLKVNETLHIHKLSQTLRLIHPLEYQYFASLRKKLQWENKPY